MLECECIECQNAGECECDNRLTGRCCMGSQMSEAPCLLACNFCSLGKNIRPCLLDTNQSCFDGHSGLLQELR